MTKPIPAGAWATRAALAVGVVLVLLHAFIPLETLIHHSDDAYYYFEVARNFPEVGFWSFDGIHKTNGVQPLWAIILTGLAIVLSWLNANDALTFVRAAVGLTAVVHCAFCLQLYRFVGRVVSPLAGLIAAGAFLFPPGIVWSHTWGLENAIYSLLLVSTVAYTHERHIGTPTHRTAALLGLLLGLTALSRLNAGFFIPITLLYCLWRFRRRPMMENLGFAFTTGAVASALVLPYLIYNLSSTGHLLPISGSAKVVGVNEYIQQHGLGARFTPAFIKFVFLDVKDRISWFVNSQLLNGLWILGARVVFNTHAASISIWPVLAFLAALAAAPALLGAPREWLAALTAAARKLSPFAYVLAYGAFNAALCIGLYPTQMDYATTRWWLAENETIIVVIVAALLSANLAYIGPKLAAARAQRIVSIAGLAFLVAWSAHDAWRYFLRTPLPQFDWSYSWNEESYAAAQWLRDNVPHDARVGSWNAAVLGYFAEQPVTNLDGLINDYRFLEYLRTDRTAEYVLEEKIEYLADMDRMFHTEIGDALELEVLYTRHHEGMKMD